MRENEGSREDRKVGRMRQGEAHALEPARVRAEAADGLEVEDGSATVEEGGEHLGAVGIADDDDAVGD